MIMNETGIVAVRKGQYRVILVEPRKWRGHVLISRQALAALCAAQDALPEHVQLVLTRGFEKETRTLFLLRAIGKILFQIAFSRRRSEASAIFGHNGHSSNGDHVDLAVEVNSTKLNLLPCGVFTPHGLLCKIEEKHSAVLKDVRAALCRAGFAIHMNATESLQIHCDLMNGKD
jgi:hypothetical protein